MLVFLTLSFVLRYHDLLGDARIIRTKLTIARIRTIRFFIYEVCLYIQLLLLSLLDVICTPLYPLLRYAFFGFIALLSPGWY